MLQSWLFFKIEASGYFSDIQNDYLPTNETVFLLWLFTVLLLKLLCASVLPELIEFSICRLSFESDELLLPEFDPDKSVSTSTSVIPEPSGFWVNFDEVKEGLKFSVKIKTTHG